MSAFWGKAGIEPREVPSRILAKTPLSLVFGRAVSIPLGDLGCEGTAVRNAEVDLEFRARSLEQVALQ